ncbi:unnamed protein product [Diamesa hyperborea]
MDDAGSVSIRICQDGHANSLALNKDNTCIAVAGRSLLKVFAVENDGFNELHNMRGTGVSGSGSNKNHNLSYSSNAVAWNSLDVNILATAATNGVVSVWDLTKFGRHKQLLVYNEHDRTTHSVTFHQTDSNLLLSGSQDGKCLLFDLRYEKSTSTFISTESVRDVKFCPSLPNTFSAVSENGTVQLWDLRRSDRFTQQFTAHSGPIYCCDWHPTMQWLATGSRDKLIKVWNMASNKPTLEYTIHTIAVVGRVKWRPDRKFHIASCASLVDYSIYIWDVRRPFIPYASFNQHSNVTTDIAFQGNPHTLLSTSKDSTIFKHSSKDAQHPAAKSNPQSGSINFRGDLLFVCKTKVKPPTLPISNSSNKLNFLQTKKIPQDTVDAVINHDQFHLAKSALHYYTQKDDPETAIEAIGSKSDDALKSTLMKDYLFLKGCAMEYKLKPDDDVTFFDLCDHNAAIAKKYGRPNVFMLWNFVKMIYSSVASVETTRDVSNNRLSAQNSNQSTNGQNGVVLTRASGSFGQSGLGGSTTNTSSTNLNNSDDKILINDGVQLANNLFNGSAGDDVLDSNIEVNGTTPGAVVIPKSLDELNVGIFDETDLTIDNIDCVKNFRNGFLYKGPHDNLIKEFPACSSSLINHDFQNHAFKQMKHNEINREQETSPEPPSVLTVPELLQAPLWKPYQVLADCLLLQSEIGDVQTSTCILLVLGDRRDELPIDKFVHENWLQSYVELLHRHQMWNEASEVINLSWIPTVCQMNEQSTVIHTTCGECGRTMQNGFYCKHCKSSDPSKCSVCHLVVKGLFAWCSGCCHGGHLEHIMTWFLTNPRCPKCNHLCEYD